MAHRDDVRVKSSARIRVATNIAIFVSIFKEWEI